MSGIDPSSRSPYLPRWRKSALIIVIVGIGAFMIWTLPNWGEFWSNVAQFPVLWQIPTNRRTIIYLTIKVISPLLIMGILTITMWLYFLIETFRYEEISDTACAEHVPHQIQAENGRDHDVPRPLQQQTAERHEIQVSVPTRAQPVSTLRHDPETPLPATLPLSEAQRDQIEGANSSARDVQDEQSPSLADQSSEIPSVGANLTPVSSFQASPISQPSATASQHNSEPLISIRLLKDVSMTINVPGDGQVVVPLSLNAKRVQLLAYIAWHRGELVERDKILEHVFGWGLPDEEATEEKLTERFESHKKLLRKKIKEVVVEQINKPAGRQVIDPDLLDPFVSHYGFWSLSDICRVEDLEIIQANHRVIALARKDGKLVDAIPEYVAEACEQLIAAYPGDFLGSLIKKYPSEFRSWQGRSSWARKPYTLYRDYYLDALWYAAEYACRMGQRYADGEMAEEALRKQQEYFGRAAQRYETYALYARDSRFDYKATFGAHGEYGERIGMSERALRRCVVLLGAIGKTDRINQVWSEYLSKMRTTSDGRWQPSKETQADVQAARARTSAYRFSAQIAQMSDFAEKQDRVS